jgi:hypothetical protein
MASSPPVIAQVKHEPTQPKSSQSVVVTAKVADRQHVAAVKLHLQSVAPGEYVRRSDPAYEKDWVSLDMRDDGQAGDAQANDGLFSVRVPSEQQKHRWLYRYRIATSDHDGNISVSPDPKDSSPNYAWFCYDGVPAWSGAREPGKPLRTFTAEFLNTIKPYHLIANGEDVATSQWDGNAHKKRFQGTFVYDGVVYDHIAFHNRGQGSAYISGKNKWGLKFNSEHSVPLQDNRGRPYRKKWTSVDLNPGTHTPYSPVHRGIAGLDEAVTFRAYQLAGVPSSSTHLVHFRVIDAAKEVSDQDQYDGDLWGLYLAISDIDQELLKEQNLPDGLLVSIQSGIKHLPDDKSAGPKEWEKFIGEMRSNPPEEWWRKNLHLKNYYRFHALNRLLGNVDIRPDGNHGYYREPDGKWSPIPWDNDMCFIPRHHQPGYIDAIQCLNHPQIKLEYQNHARELLDLFAADASPTGGQIGQLVAELGKVLSPPGHATNWAQLDDTMWNWHPRFNQKGSFFINPAYGDHFGGRWERRLATNDIQGFEKYLVEFCTDSRPQKNYAPNDGNPLGYGWGYVALEAHDEAIPEKPTIDRESTTGKIGQYKVTSAAPPGKFQVEWRVGRVGDAHFEIEEHWRSNPDTLNDALQIRISPQVFQDSGVYRIRARLHAPTGRVSHWSEPVTEVVK